MTRNYKGEANPNARMTTAQVIKVCRLLSQDDGPYPSIAIKAGVSLGQVEGIAKRQTWVHVSQQYIFKPRAVSVRRGLV